MPLSIKVKANKNIFGIYANGGWRLHNHKLLSFPHPGFCAREWSADFWPRSMFWLLPGFWPTVLGTSPGLLEPKSQLQIANSVEACNLAIHTHPLSFTRISPEFSRELVARR